MNIKSRMASISAAAAMLVSVLSINVGTNIEAKADFEKNAVQTVADMGFGWNLGNSLDSYSGTVVGSNLGSTSSETAWGNPATTKAMIDMVKASGVETVRVPVTWYEHMDPVTYKIDDVWMNRVEEVVNYVLEDDMYCIINVHHDTGENGWLKANSTNLDTKKAMYTAIWEQVSANFADYGDKLLFESLNEILDGSANQWYNPSSEAVPITNDLNQVFVDVVRKSGGNNTQRNLICNTYCAGANREITSQVVLPKDTVSNRLIVETHIYQPFPFTSESYPNVTTWDSTSLDMYIDNIYNQFVKNGTPVIIGEFGCANKNNIDQITSWAKYYVEKCTGYGIPCIWWDNGNQYKLYNRRTLKVTEPDLLNTMIAAAKGEDYVIDTSVKGDVNGDGQFNISDVVILQKWLLAVPNTTLVNWKAADLCADERLDVFDLIAMRQSLVSADNLCASEDNWNSWVDTSAGADAEMTYTSNGVKMQVNAGGEYEWNAQFFYEGLTLEQGSTYKISFDYKADSKQSTSFHVMQGHDDYLPYYSGNLDWTTTAQHYEDTFEYTKATDKVCRIGFNLGGSGVKVPFTVEVANLSLVKVSGGSTAATPSTPSASVDVSGENLCADDNWTSWVNEEGGSSATVEYLGDGIKINVTSSGEEEWYIQGSYPDITLEEGAEYQVSFDYSADKAISLWYHIQQNYDPYGQYIYELLDYTTKVQHYTGTFKMSDKTDKNVICVFNCGGADPDVPFSVTIENLSLVKIS
ncbi:MAG: cellulase family glycosylhydrolase [Ruminococcus sp.]|nr:cellulase family glycosylhydrolase [Ruminococcus sp.]